MKPSDNGRPKPKSGLHMHDILYVLFKHKWKIMTLSLIGFAAAGALAFKQLRSPSYETHAKLLVRYVVERNVGDPDAPIMRSGAKPETIMDTELEILKSFDIAIETAGEVGPAKLLPNALEPPTSVEAASAVASRFAAQSQRGSNVIHLSYRDSEPKLAVEVLGQLIQSYFERHLAIHRSTTAFDQVTTQADQARSALRTTEDEINRLKAESGVISIEGTTAEFESRRQMVRHSLMEAQAALAEQRAKVAALEKSAPARPADAKPEDAGEGAQRAVSEEDAQRRRTAEAIVEYQDVMSRLELLRQERNQLLVRRPARDPLVMSLERQISAQQRRSVDLVEKNPQLANRVQVAGVSRSAAAPVTTLEDERALQVALEARIEELTKQSTDVENEVESLSSLGFKLESLMRRRQMEEEKYRYYQSSLEKARVDETLDPSKIPNISIVQSPSAPVRSIDPMAMKLIVGLAAFGLAAGVALAFLIEYVFDRRVSRPIDIRTRLQLPLMMSIPYLRTRESHGKLMGGESNLRRLENAEDPSSPPPVPEWVAAQRNGNGKDKGKHVAHEEEHFITPFALAIHDRIIFNFEVNNLTHKPKLVALTALSSGAGASTIAVGLAKAFSSHCKVLLLDLNPPKDGPRPPHSPAEVLRQAIEVSRGPNFRQSHKNLYCASVPTLRHAGSSTALAPIGLHEIMPHLISSDYDYILFDMPPVDPTSPTLSMAGFMDKVLLVLDAEATTPENVNWAYSELERGRADVSCIFNKAKAHAPRWVAGGF